MILCAKGSETNDEDTQDRPACRAGRGGQLWSGKPRGGGIGAGAEFSVEPRHPGGAVSAGRLDRHHDARDRRQAFADVGPAGAGRQQGRRQRHHRGRVREECQARRLYAARHLVDDACRQSGALRQAALRSDRRLRADHAHEPRADGGAGHQEARREDAGRADGQAEGRARQAQFRLGRDLRARCGRALSDAGRHRRGLGVLQEQPAGRARPEQRHHHLHDLRHRQRQDDPGVGLGRCAGE